MIIVLVLLIFNHLASKLITEGGVREEQTIIPEDPLTMIPSGVNRDRFATMLHQNLTKISL